MGDEQRADMPIATAVNAATSASLSHELLNAELRSRTLDAARPLVTGSVVRVLGLRFDVAGLNLPLGASVTIIDAPVPVSGEVVALNDGTVTCMPHGELVGVRVGHRVVSDGGRSTVPVGHCLLGRVIDAMGNPLDDLGPLMMPDGRRALLADVDNAAPHPLRRARIDTPLSLGVRAWDTLIPAGRGQRVGVFAGSGVGKSTLMGMIARNAAADVNVVALIGERGREVREFLESDLGPEGLARSVVIVATSDQPALARLRAAFAATRIAEWFRDQGLDVMLMMDSLTRFCMAQREIGLSAGEPPTSRGYPPSVFSLLPRLLERAGPAPVGSITGIYTVLVDGDDQNEPIADAVRSILDGHVVLSRKLAHANHYPAIDVLASVSRVTGAVTTREQRLAADEVRRLMAAHAEARDLIEIGAYVAGTNPTVDRAIALRPHIDQFLRQQVDDHCDAATAQQMIAAVVGGGG